MKYTIALLIFFSFAFTAFAEEKTLVKNAGFIPANIWYSKDPFFAGDKIRIYTAIFNGGEYDLSGIVEFYDNQTLISKEDFSIAGNGRLHDIWTDWTVKEGTHTISARIVQTTISEQGKQKQPVQIENSEIGKNERIIDFDTDGDNIGNKDDSDDDNDGVSDIQEIKNGTNSLEKNIDAKQIETPIKYDSSREESLAEKGNETIEKIKEAVATVNNNIPDTVKNVLSSSIETVENFRQDQSEQFRTRKEEKAKDIEEIKKRQKSSIAKNPEEKETKILMEKYLAYGLLAIDTTLQYVFDWQIAFYILILYILYSLFQWRKYANRNPRY